VKSFTRGNLCRAIRGWLDALIVVTTLTRPYGRNLVDKAAPPKEQPKVSTDPTIKSDKKKKDSELAENELNQVTGGGWDVKRNKPI
jgi:bacteriocin-like protein